MQSLGLGKLIETGQKPLIFEKISEDEVKANFAISKVFKELGMNTTLYFNKLNEKAIEIRSHNKGILN